MRKFKFLLVAVLVVPAALAAGEGPAAPAEFAGRTASVAVFKSGYGFFRVEGEATPVGGKVEIAPLPAAALGTWSFYTRDQGVIIDAAIAGEREVKKARVPLSLEELIMANPGRAATVETENQTYTGAILPNGAWASDLPPQPHPERLTAAPGQEHWAYRQDLMLRSGENVISIRRQDVRAVTIENGTADFHVTERESYVTLYLEGAGARTPIGYEFLQKGIRWIPSYRIEIIDDEKASLLLQADVINDIRDLEDTTLQLVVGVPNFMHGELISPLAYISKLPELSLFFQPPGRTREVGYFSNALVSQVDMPYRGEEIAGGAVSFSVPSEITSQGVSDLYYYAKENVRLKKGERASLRIFSGECKYGHVYKWKVSPDAPVEHCLRLENSSGMPFTSGPAMLLSKGSVMAQDTMKYTPDGDSVDVKVTDAVDIKKDHWENEIARKHNALVAFGRQHDQVEAKGTLTLRNFKEEKVHLIATRELDGVVAEASDGAEVAKYVTDIKSVNPHSRIEWEFDLDPGQEKTMTYSYSTYVRN